MNSHGKSNYLIASAVAAAIGSGSAFALPPGSLAGATVLYAAGGSAQANAFYVAVADNLQQTPTCSIDSYTNTTNATDSGQYRIVTGTTSAAMTYGGGTLPAGTNVIYMYKFNGGSFVNGVAPQQVSGATTLAYPTVASLQIATTTGAAAGAGCSSGLPTYQYAANTGTAGVAPDWGVADLEVAMFSGYNNATGNAGGIAVNTNGGAAPTVGATTGLYDNLFGVAVTHNLYTGTHPKTNFSRAEVEGIIEGTISDWSQLYADDGTVLSAGGIVFLDRGEGSGSKASGNQYFLCYPGCGGAARLPFSATHPYTGTTATINELNPQDVAEGSSTTIIADLKLLQAGGFRGIAVLGMEFPPHANQVGGLNVYDFVKINGVAVDTGTTGDDLNGPTGTSYVNAVRGSYDYYYQNSFNTRTGFLANCVAAPIPPATVGLPIPGCIFANQIKVTMTSAGFVGADVGGKFPQGVGGTLLDADLASTLTKGMTINTRNKVSTAPLQPKLSAISPFPVSNDPL
jgi:hypothetical protein